MDLRSELPSKSEESVNEFPTANEAVSAEPLKFTREVAIKGLPYIFEGELPPHIGRLLWVLRVPNWQEQAVRMRELIMSGDLSSSIFGHIEEQLRDPNAVASVDFGSIEEEDGKEKALYLTYIRTMTSMLPQEYGYKSARGLGSFLLDNLNALADSKNLRVYLNPSARDGGMDDSELTHWYYRHGYTKTNRKWGFQRDPQTPDPQQVISQILNEKTK